MVDAVVNARVLLFVGSNPAPSTIIFNTYYMKYSEFIKYEGKKTTGTVDGINIDGGIVVGFNWCRGERQLVARLNNRNGVEGYCMSIKFMNKDEEAKYYSNSYTYCLCSTSNVIMEESKLYDLTEILKGCNGVKLWSDICGHCTLIKIDLAQEYPLILQTKSSNGVDEISFGKHGKYVTLFTDGKCTLWPSETLRDWSKFKRPKNPNIPKEGELVACFDVQWHKPQILRYKGGNFCYVPKVGTQNPIPEALAWKYIIPMKDYNPDLSENELKALSIV